MQLYKNSIDCETFKAAFAATCRQRGTELQWKDIDKILTNIESSHALKELWESYRKKYSYATDIAFEETIKSVKQLAQIFAENNE